MSRSSDRDGAERAAAGTNTRSAPPARAAEPPTAVRRMSSRRVERLMRPDSPQSSLIEIPRPGYPSLQGVSGAAELEANRDLAAVQESLPARCRRLDAAPDRCNSRKNDRTTFRS